MTEKTLYNGLRKTQRGWEIDIQLDELRQLFSAPSPLPLPYQDIEPRILDYVTELVQQIPEKDPAKFVLWMPREQIRAEIVSELRGDFGILLKEIVRRQREQTAHELRESIVAFVYGLIFMLLCQVIRYFVSFENPMLQQTLSEGLLVLGWVALWRPFELLLFSWWPAYAKIRFIRRTGKFGIDVRCSEKRSYWMSIIRSPAEEPDGYPASGGKLQTPASGGK